MRYLNFLFFFIFLTSCSDNSLQKKIDELTIKNDSLNSELKKYENKYVFDRVIIKHYPINNSQVKKGTKYFGELVFVPSVEEDFVLFGADKFNKEGHNIKAYDTLRTGKGDSGAYKFEVDIVSDTTLISFNPLIRNKTSLKHLNAGYNGLQISDILIVK